MTEDEKQFFVELGARLAELRQQRGLTQAEVATRLGVSQQTVNSFEKGRRRVPVSTLPDLAELLEVSIEQLIEGERAAPKRGPASKLQRQLEQIKKLPRSKQRFVIEMLDTVIAQAQRSNAP
jgi:transcriptional regulator with XRE-family HTH domain